MIHTFIRKRSQATGLLFSPGLLGAELAYNLESSPTHRFKR